MKDVAWAYAEMIDNQMHCKFCYKKIRGGGGHIHKLKQHLVGIRGQIVPCATLTEQIGDIRKDFLEKFEKFEEEKYRQNEIEAKIGRKMSIKHMMTTNPNFDYEGSSYIPYTNASNPFIYVPPFLDSIQEKGKGKIKKKGDVKIYFIVTPSSPYDSAHCPQANSGQMQPTLDDHWKK